MHKNLYVEGLTPNESELYRETIETFGFDAEAILAKMKSDEALRLAYGDFDLAKKQVPTYFHSVIYKIVKVKRKGFCAFMQKYHWLSIKSGKN